MYARHAFHGDSTRAFRAFGGLLSIRDDKPRAEGGLRSAREARGLSQAALAEAVGLARQSLNAIETGRAVPGVDVALRIARVLEAPVEALFGSDSDESRLTTEVESALRQDARVALAHVGGRWLSYPLGPGSAQRSADAIAAPARGGKVHAELLRSAADCRDNLVVMGCAPVLGLLSDRLNARANSGRYWWLLRSSGAALEALSRGETHVAGVHLVDSRTGEANVPDVREYGARRTLTLVTLGRWEVGLVVPASNPKRIKGVGDLGRRGLRLAGREAGSGARRLLERELARAGIPLSVAENAVCTVPGHLEVAQAVFIGAADVGVATRDAALVYDLRFIPLAEERYDLVVPRDELNDARITRLFDVMTTSAFRREIAALGYDARQCGDRVAEIRAR